MKFDDIKTELLSIADSSLKHGRSIDPNAEYEIFLYYRASSQTKINQGMVDATDGLITGNAVRVAQGKKISFTSSSGIELKDIKRSIQEAITICKKLDIQDERFEGFINSSQGEGKDGIIVDEVLELTPDILLEKANNLITEAREADSRIKSANSSYSVTKLAFAVGNTNGVEVASRVAANSFDIGCVALDGETRKTGYDFDGSRETVLDETTWGNKTAQKAIDLLEATPLDKKAKMPTIWDNVAFGTYIMASLNRAIQGNVVVEGLSPLSDKIGEKLASSQLTVIDDGVDPTSLQTLAYDAEGTKSRKNIILDNGVLKSFVFDSYYANIFGTESTGNCTRTGGTLPYESPPSVGTTTLDIQPGSKSEQELLESVDGSAIYIQDMPIGMLHSNVATGEFSIKCPNVFLVENGEKVKALDAISVAGNFYEGFENIIAIGNNIRKTPFGINLPSIVFDGFSVVG